MGTAKTYWKKYASSTFPSFVIRVAILFPATTGWMVSVQNRIGQKFLKRRGTPSKAISSASTNFLAGASWRAPLPCLGLNLGTGTPESAAALVEYCNVDKGTKWSDLRRKHGVADPYQVKNWCLGNEMDGPWQIGHMTARGVRRESRRRCPSDALCRSRALSLIACGSSNIFMPTYLQWDHDVLEQCYEYVDAISLHRYLRQHDRNRRRQFKIPCHESEYGSPDFRSCRSL